MATIHRTTMAPTKTELLAAWLPRQPWYRDRGRPPVLTPAGGFRLDDPAGDVGLEFIVITDGTDAEETAYFVPLSYRGAALPEAEGGLLGTSEHGVLGRRWIYDAAHDPVAVGRLLAFVCGATEAQHQNVSDTPDPTVVAHWASAGRLTAPGTLQVVDDPAGRTTVAVDLTGDSAAGTDRPSLEIVRVLQAAASVETDGAVLGSVVAGWRRLDGVTARGPVVVVR